MSWASNGGLNSFVSSLASAAPTLKVIMVPIFPKTASLTPESSIWARYWFAIVNARRYFLASERILLNDSVAKF